MKFASGGILKNGQSYSPFESFGSFSALPKSDDGSVDWQATSPIRHVSRGKLSGCLSARAQKLSSLRKIGIVVEEADETVFWLELLSEQG